MRLHEINQDLSQQYIDRVLAIINVEPFKSHIDLTLFQEDSHTIEIEFIGATPKHQGWGSKALKVICDIATEMGIELRLEVENGDDFELPDEDVLIQLYSKFGFEIVGINHDRTQMERKA